MSNFIEIKSSVKNYKAFFEKDDAFLKNLARLENSVFVIDENVFKLYYENCLREIPIKKIIKLEISETKKILTPFAKCMRK